MPIYEYANEYLVYIKIKSSDDFSHVILTVITIIFNFFRIYSGLISSQKQINALYIQQKLIKIIVVSVRIP